MLVAGNTRLVQGLAEVLRGIECTGNPAVQEQVSPLVQACHPSIDCFPQSFLRLFYPGNPIPSSVLCPPGQKEKPWTIVHGFLANPVDYDTRDGCTRLRNQGAFLHPLFLNERRIDLINQFLMQHRPATYRTDDMHNILHGSIQVIVHHNVVIGVGH